MPASFLDYGAQIFSAVLLFGFVCSLVIERLAQWMGMRERELQRGLELYIVGKDRPDVLKCLLDHPLIQSLIQESPFTKTLNRTPLVRRYVYQGNAPTYIPPRYFVTALFETLVPSTAKHEEFKDLGKAVAALPPSSPMRAAILALMRAADGNMEHLRKRVEDWFDLTIHKTTVDYRRKTQALSLLIAVVICITLNVDAIAIFRSLWNDQLVRSVLVADAEKYAPGTPEKALAMEQLDSYNLPIGWSPLASVSPSSFGWVPVDWLPRPYQANQSFGGSNYLVRLVEKIFGWIVVALAGAESSALAFDALKKNRNPMSFLK